MAVTEELAIATRQRPFGSAVKRREDPRLITGRGPYLDDLVLPGMLHMTLLGFKGIGEAGRIGSWVPVVNSVVDALSYLGINHLDMPPRPKRVWGAIQAAQGGK